MGFINRNIDGPAIAFFFRITTRILQFVLALTAAGLYGIRIDNERKAHLAPSPQWLYAEVVAGLSVLSCIVYMVPSVKSYLFFAWDAVLFILWIVVFGVFAKLYLHRSLAVSNEYQGTNTLRMQHAVWIDLINVLLWLLTAVGGLVRFFVARRERSLHTGRALVNA